MYTYILTRTYIYTYIYMCVCVCSGNILFGIAVYNEIQKAIFPIPLCVTNLAAINAL